MPSTLQPDLVSVRVARSSSFVAERFIALRNGLDPMRSLSLILLFASFGGVAQENPLIASYELTELDGAIRIDWSIQGGTCNGQDVERSTDGNNFTGVHHIEGICGGSGAPVPYSWTDATPPEYTTVYYRVKLGIVGYTSVMSVNFDQLTTSAQRFFPSPMNGEATLVLNVTGKAAVDLFIWDPSGRLMQQQEGVPGPVLSITLPGTASGVYHYRAISDGRVFEGQFVRE